METASKCPHQFEGDPNAPVHPNIQTLFKRIPVMEQRSAKWYEERKKRISASDVASAIGCNKYKSCLSLVIDKLLGSEFKGNKATEHGQKYEPVAIEKFVRQTGYTVFEVGLVEHPVHKWLAGSPDGVCAENALVEIKCPLSREIQHSVPPHYMPQIQICMESCNVDRCFFIQLRPEMDGKPEIFDVLEVPRDREWFRKYLPILRHFWMEVMFFRAFPRELWFEKGQIVEDLYTRKT